MYGQHIFVWKFLVSYLNYTFPVKENVFSSFFHFFYQEWVVKFVHVL